MDISKTGTVDFTGCVLKYLYIFTIAYMHVYIDIFYSIILRYRIWNMQYGVL